MIPQNLSEFESLLRGCHHAKSAVVVTATVRNLFELLNSVECNAELVAIVRNCRKDLKPERN